MSFRPTTPDGLVIRFYRCDDCDVEQGTHSSRCWMCGKEMEGIPEFGGGLSNTGWVIHAFKVQPFEGDEERLPIV